jgi:microcystin-dependent protein
MKYILALFAGILLVSSAAAQTKKIPVQGKLFENNLPVTGNRNLTFSIASLGWNLPLNNVPVSEGLYTVELDVPADLFATQASHDLSISVNGTPLSTVKIHAPIESDPTVPANLKDGVSWNEVTDKPATLDLDPANEIQTLTINGTQLSISGGNTVPLPVGSGGNGVFDTLVVGPLKLATVTCPSVLSGSQSEFRQTVNQTFFAECTGSLTLIEVFCANSNSASIEFKVRTLGGQQVADGFFPPSAFSPAFGFQPFVPSSPNASLTQNVQYVIEFTVSGGSTYGFGYDSNDPYKFGQSNIVPGNDADLRFKVNIEKTVGPSMQIDSNGMVGIGLSNPSATLHVNGRIKDKTGFLVPVGTIFPFAGEIAPEGWLLCDGSEVPRAVYPELFEAIQTRWGFSNSASFRLPDLRGEFLRGWDGGTGNDPDPRVRRYADGVTSGVGSYQDDEFRSHTHGLIDGSDNGNGAPKVRPFLAANNAIPQPNTKAAGGSETRPRNAAVLYIIKY